jgi:hypothetical protein
MTYSMASFGVAAEPACPEGQFMTAYGCMTKEQWDQAAKDMLSHLPPPCDDPEKMRQMFRDVGIPVAMPDSSYDKKQASMIAILRWCQENEIDCRDDQEVCDALVEESAEARAGTSTGTIVAVVAVGAVALGGVVYLSRRRA